jgi:hypothetical protein
MPSCFLLVVVLALVAVAPGGAAQPDPKSKEAARCRSAVPWPNARRQVGMIAEIKGPVVGATYARARPRRPTFLYLGRKPPHPRRFTAVIFGRDRPAFGAPEKTYRGRTICVIGHVELVRGVPQTEVTTPSQIRIVK